MSTPITQEQTEQTQKGLHLPVKENPKIDNRKESIFKKISTQQTKTNIVRKIGSSVEPKKSLGFEKRNVSPTQKPITSVRSKSITNTESQKQTSKVGSSSAVIKSTVKPPTTKIVPKGPTKPIEEKKSNYKVSLKVLHSER